MEGYVSTIGVGERCNAGIGYVIIPKEFDVKNYENYCQNTNSVFILLDSGGYIKAILPPYLIDYIKFPKNKDERGSQICWLNIDKKNEIIVIAILQNSNSFLNTKRKIFLGNKIEKLLSLITIDKDTGDIIINADSVKDSGGNILIKSKNKSLDSQININVSGNIDIKTQKTNIEVSNSFNIKIVDLDKDKNVTEINYKKGIGLNYIDEFDNKIQITKDGVIFNDGENGGLVNINTLKSALNDLQNQITILKNTLKGSFTSLSALDGSASLNVYNSGIISMNSININQIENKKIKH